MSEQKIYVRLTTSSDLTCATFVIASEGRMTLQDITDSLKDYLNVMQQQLDSKEFQ